MSDLLDRLEALVNKWETGNEWVNDFTRNLRSIIADERKRQEPVAMSCPSCCKVQPCVETREMCCSVCLAMFETPEQLDANLNATRRARGIPDVVRKP